MKPEQPRYRAALALTLVAMLSACGGGDDASAPPAGSPNVGTGSGSASGSGSAAATDTGSGTNPAAKPGASNTGVPAGTPLTRRVGDLTLTEAGQVIDGLDLEGCVAVKAKGVIIRRSRIRCDSYYPVEVYDGASLLIEDSEIDGSPSGGIATSSIAFSNYTARRLNVHGTADGFKADANAVIENSWVHDLWLADGDHADGIQGTGGGKVVVRGNLIDIRDTGSGHGGEPNSALQIGIEWGSNSNWTIEGNWLYGGGWIINADAGEGSGNKITANRFGPAGFGPVSTNGNWVVSGNLWDNSGNPI